MSYISNVSRPIVAGAVVSLLMAGSAQAVVTQYFGEDLVSGDRAAPRPNANAARAAFFAPLSGIATEDFESFANSSNPATLMFGPATATLTSGGTGTLVRSISTGNFVGLFPTSGVNVFEISSASSSAAGSFTLSFNQPQSAFGFYGTDLGDVGTRLVLEFTQVGGNVLTVPVPHTVGTGANINGAVVYFGLIGSQASEAFSSVRFRGDTSTSDRFGFDDLSIGDLSVVPEPTSLALLGLGGLAMRRRR